MKTLDRLIAEAAALRGLILLGFVKAGAPEGHEFYGNQWTHESLAQSTEPLRKNYHIGDEVVWRKDDGTVGRGQLGFKQGNLIPPHSMSKADWRKHLLTEGHHEVLEGDKKVLVPSAHLRHPISGFKNKDFVHAEGMTDNERHAAETVLRSAQLVMVGNWIEQELTGRLTQLKGELVSEVKQDKPTKDNTERLFTNAEKRILNALRDVKLDLQTHLRKVGVSIGERHQEAMKAHHDLAGKAPKVTPSETPVGGLTLDEHFQKMGDDLITRFKAQMRIGLEADETTAELVRRIEGFGDVKASEPDMVHAASPLTALASILKAAEKSLSTLIQAAIKATANAIENGFFNDLDEDEVEEMGFVWVCAMERTCDLCLAYDGSKWDSDMNPIDGAPPYPGDPPDSTHINCQCEVPECNLNEEVRVKGKKLDSYLQEADPKVLEASFGKANTRAFLEGDLNGNELLKTDHVLSPEAFARLKPAWKEFEEASK